MSHRRVIVRLATLMVTISATHGNAQAQSSVATGTTPLRTCCADVRPNGALVDTVPSLWRVAGNASDAAVAVRDAGPWRRTRIDMAHDAGTSYRPQDAEATTRGRLGAEGGRRVGAWATLGRVGYERTREDGVHWRHHTEAYDGMQYSWADSVGGAFTRDVLTLGATAATPQWRGFRGGMAIDYGLGQGARQNDPRPLSRRRVMELAPGASWARHRHHVGVALRKEWVREDLEIGGGSSTEYPVLFRLRGISTFDRTQLISGERAMLGGALGATIGYAFRSASWQMATSGSARRFRIEARDGIATPVTGGTSRIVRYEGRLLVRRAATDADQQFARATTAPRMGLELDAGIRQETSRGTDPIFAAVNAIDEGWTAPLTLTWWRGADPVSASWRTRVGVEAAGLSRRDVASLAQWSVRSWRPGASAAHRLGREGAWTVELSVASTRVGETLLDVSRPTRLTDVLVIDDARLLQTSRWMTSTALSYEIRKGTDVRARAHAAVGLLRHPDLALSNRTAHGRAHWTFSWELM